MRYFLILGLLCFTLTASLYYTKSMASWQGQTMRALIAKKGQPWQLIKEPHRTILIYKTEAYQTGRTIGSPAIGVNTTSGRPVFVTNPNNFEQNPAYSAVITCYTTYIVENNRIVDTRVEGSGCQ